MNTVSYTHLDVYKRQMLDSINLGPCPTIASPNAEKVARFPSSFTTIMSFASKNVSNSSPLLSLLDECHNDDLAFTSPAKITGPFFVPLKILSHSLIQMCIRDRE